MNSGIPAPAQGLFYPKILYLGIFGYRT